ncbi:MAG: hypothetical protein K2R93_18865 [Gemmatimonadaceae bacterium]|nr:hypothetical protein [Gemmatimonadaceae bacterium]
MSESPRLSPIVSLPALLTPAQAARLLMVSVSVLPSLRLPEVPVPSRGAGLRRHVRYRLTDVIAAAGSAADRR